MKLSFFQKVLSFLYPVKITVAKGVTTPLLALYRFRGRWQLSAATALYSDGPSYRPLTTAFKYLEPELPAKRKMLVLGAGLGSAVAILQKMELALPDTTLVDIDPQIIQWGRETLETEARWICSDVQDFVRDATAKDFDLLIIDIFQDRLVPQFVTKAPFLEACSRLLQKGSNSVVVLNYIINNEEQWKVSLQEIKAVFSVEHIISIDINRILILRNSA